MRIAVHVMSGIAGIIRFDGAPVEPGLIEKMTSAIAHRGPDGIHHWTRGSVALGHCMLQTTPESLEESQPLANEDESLVLVMDGRVDNWVELRRELLARGAVLRTRADAELVLRAYEVWGEACPDRIIGEYVFFAWDKRRASLFAARDAAGTRHFYYHAGDGWFAFASEIKGLLALDDIVPRLNESRILDYLVPKFDRDDVVGTFYQGISRMPAGHAMTVAARGLKIRRWWDPSTLPEARFVSLDECAEAFREQLSIAVKCRLRSIGPVGAMLSGGLDSSSIVGLVDKELRSELTEPLRTFSLIREDRENCPDWHSIQHMIRDSWFVPTILTSAAVDELRPGYLGCTGADEPFALTHGLTYRLVYETAARHGCRLVLDGMAGDFHFYGPERSLASVIRSGRYGQVSAVLAAYRRHGIKGGPMALVRAVAARAAPGALKAVYRKVRDERAVRDPDLRLLRPDVARELLAGKRTAGRSAVGGDQAGHASIFSGGLLSFGHEVCEQIAARAGVEPRSPFSDRRLIEFSIRMPLEAKLCADWYKPVLRKASEGILPAAVLGRRIMGGNPGWTYYLRLISSLANEGWDGSYNRAGRAMLRSCGIEDANLEREVRFAGQDVHTGLRVFRLLALSSWLQARNPLLHRGMSL